MVSTPLSLGGVPSHLTLAQFTAPQHAFLVGLLLFSGSVAVVAVSGAVAGSGSWRLAGGSVVGRSRVGGGCGEAVAAVVRLWRLW